MKPLGHLSLDVLLSSPPINIMAQCCSLGALSHTQERACPTFELKPFPAALSATAAPSSLAFDFLPLLSLLVRPGAFDSANQYRSDTFHLLHFYSSLSVSLLVLHDRWRERIDATLCISRALALGEYKCNFWPSAKSM